MEEKEVITSGQENPEAKQEQKRLSYDELRNIAAQLDQQCQMLSRQNSELRDRLAQTNGIEARLHYMFKILENKFAFDEDYIIEVADEIKDIMTIKNDAPENTEEEQKE